MGNYLSSPNVEKHTLRNSGNDLLYGLSSMQGWRTSMEDAHVATYIIPTFPGASFFAVFDGHGGTLAAEFSAEHIISTLISQDGFNETLDADGIGSYMTNCFLTLDVNMRCIPSMASGDDYSGTTAIASFITKTHIIVANTGDSRSVIAKKGAMIPMSFDHKPIDPVEEERIKNAGGMVRNNRVNGDLAVSRALGDFVYKNRNDLPASSQQVSPVPDIKIEPRDGSEEFLIIACDGIWDVMSNEEICHIIRQLLQLGEKDLGLIAEELIDQCLGLGSRDNMSAIIIALPGIQYGSGTGVLGLREKRVSDERTAMERRAIESANLPPAPSATATTPKV